jgi:hypothetical protein
VEQPTKVEIFLNVKAAAATGVALPPALLQRADRIVE